MLGFLGSAHCLGMCGGLSAALGLNTQQGKLGLLLAYNLARICSYMGAGLIVGSLGFWLSQTLGAAVFLRYLAASMLVMMGLYLGAWFNGIHYVEKLGQHLWKRLQPLANRLLPVHTAGDAFLIGLVWGWLPCGLVYSALIWASAEASVLGSVGIMLFFGLGTLPSMLTTGYFAKQLSDVLRATWLRSSAGVLMILFGLWSMPITQQLALQVFS